MQHTSSIDEGRRRLEQRRALDQLAERLELQEFHRSGGHLFSVPRVTEQAPNNAILGDDPDWPGCAA
jgi:hypothetical protein